MLSIVHPFTLVERLCRVRTPTDICRVINAWNVLHGNVTTPTDFCRVINALTGLDGNVTTPTDFCRVINALTGLDGNVNDLSHYLLLHLN